MLVLSRNVDERIIIQTPNGRVVITVVRIKGGGPYSSVRLGFDASEDVDIYREELVDRLRPANGD